MAISVDGCRIKIERARAHVLDIRRSFGNFLLGDRLNVPLVREVDCKSGSIIIKVEALPECSADLSAVLGDAIHNYRSSLDYLWWQLAIKNLGREPNEKEARSIQFPILSEREQWGGRCFKYVCLDDVKCFEKFMPFNKKGGENHLLEIFAKLSNYDKHRSIHFVYASPRASEAKNATDRPLRVSVPNNFTVIQVGTEVMRFVGDIADLDAESAVEARFTLEARVLEDFNIFALLNDIDSMCCELIKVGAGIKL